MAPVTDSWSPRRPGARAANARLVRRRSAIAAALAAAALSVGCGGVPKPPVRGVIESNLPGWDFRRYQKVLDVEVWVAHNPAVAHTASYARAAAERRGRLRDEDVVSAFVTRYRNRHGILRALILFAHRLAQESGYRVTETSIGGVRLIRVTGRGEAWALWPSTRHVVKIGGPGRESIPAEVVKAYGSRYPSGLSAGALEGPLPGSAAEPATAPSHAGSHHH